MPNNTLQEFTIEIVDRDCDLHLLPSPSGVPKAHRFQGGLIYSPGLQFSGRVLIPHPHRGQAVRIWISEMSPGVIGFRDRLDLGSIEQRSLQPGENEILGSIYLPPATLEAASVCLGSVWKSICLSVVGNIAEHGSITSVSFSGLVGTEGGQP